MIPEATIQQIKDQMRIEEVVGDYVNLKRRGSNYIGLCPFHGERTPSFNVNPARGIFKCFGCGEGGDAISFIRQHDGVSYVEALRHIARKYGIEVQEEEVSPELLAEKKRSDALSLVNQFARDFYHKQLTQTDEGKSVGLSYFKHRGYSQATIDKFELGFAPASGTALKDAAARAGYKEEYLRDLGLLTKDARRDFLRDRVIFPILNLSGKVVAFAGRILKLNSKAPKYLNSPETELYHKSRVLYGMHLARIAMRREDSCIITEGYADVIALHQAGIENTVATCGTSLTPEHVQLIKRLTKRVIFLYDGDKAGIKAAMRGLDMVLAQDMEVRLVLLPDDHDPDSYVKEHGGEAFRQYVEAEAKDFIAYKTDLLLDESKADPVKRSQLVHDVLRSISKVPDPILRTEYLRQTSERFAYDEQQLAGSLESYVRENLEEAKRKQQVAARSASRELAADGTKAAPAEKTLPAGGVTTEPTEPVYTDQFREEDLVKLLISFGDKPVDEAGNSVAVFICHNVKDVIGEFDSELCQRVVEDCLQRLEAGQTVSTDYWTGHREEDVKKLAVDALADPHLYSPGWWERFEIVLTTQKMPEENWVSAVQTSVLRFKLGKLVRKLEQIAQRLQVAQAENDDASIQRQLRLFMKVNAAKASISEALRSVVVR